MEVQEYCRNMSVELAGWKAKMYDVVMKLGKLQADQKKRFDPQIKELNKIIDDLSERIRRLKNECPPDWKPDEKEIKARVAHIQKLMKDVWDPLTVGK